MLSHGEKLVSVHGGHSVEFCSHARDRLSEIVARYAELGFTPAAVAARVQELLG